MADVKSPQRHGTAQATDPKGPTGALATWVAETSLDSIPIHVQERANRGHCRKGPDGQASGIPAEHRQGGEGG